MHFMRSVTSDAHHFLHHTTYHTHIPHTPYHIPHTPYHIPHINRCRLLLKMASESASTPTSRLSLPESYRTLLDDDEAAQPTLPQQQVTSSVEDNDYLTAAAMLDVKNFQPVRVTVDRLGVWMKPYGIKSWLSPSSGDATADPLGSRILHDIKAILDPGKLVAIMGASGTCGSRSPIGPLPSLMGVSRTCDNGL
jgi:hypothetical protein